MYKTFFPTLIFSLLTPLITYGQSNSWNGIIPLISTKSDVEKIPSIKINGKCEASKNFYNCIYILDERQINVDYASDTCFGGIYGFNVPKETVLKVTVYSVLEESKSFEELNLNKDKFSHSNDDGMTGYWTDPEEGKVYHFANIRQQLTSIAYIPKKSDNNLRCDGFPPYLPEGHHYTQFTNYFYEKKINKKEYLEWLKYSFEAAIHVSEKKGEEHSIYLLIYFDDKLPFSEYKKLFDEAKRLIFKKNKNYPDQITFIEGGLKETSAHELYI